MVTLITAITFSSSFWLSAQGFPSGNVYVAGFGSKNVVEFDANFNFVSNWTNPSFTSAPEGPAGMVFNSNGDLVVAAYDQFCVYSAPNVLVNCFPKVAAQRTENIIFDSNGNLYTTTSTGGTNQIHKYDANFNFITTFSMPTGQLTGITCDPSGNLYLSSQSCGCIYVVDNSTFAVLDVISGVGNSVEGIQFTSNNKILVARSFTTDGILVIEPFGPTATILTTVSDPNFQVLVPVTIDNAGNYYTADHNGGSGSGPSDLFKYDSNGSLIASGLNTSAQGPFGIVVAGTILPCGAMPAVPTLSQWGLIILGLSILCIGTVFLLKGKGRSQATT